MASPNLSLENIARTIATLGTSAVLAACTKSAEPAAVKADQTPVTTASATAAAPPAPPPPAQPAADERAREPGAAPEGQAAGGGAGAAPTTSGAPAAPAHKASTMGRHQGATGQASCGAGTCSSDMKKK